MWHPQDEDEARYFLQALEKQNVLDLHYDKLKNQLFPHQLQFFTDPAPFKAALCSRRAGKTYACAVALIHKCVTEKESMVLYIALTRKSAKRIIWPILKKINRKFNLGGTPQETELEMRFPNDSVISVVGANLEDMGENLRGLAFKTIIIDEAASFRPHLSYLIDDVLAPSLMDYHGTLSLIGTPSAACMGPFFDATTSKSMYSVHKWTVLDNPYIPHAGDWLENYRIQKGWSLDNPVYLREWRGQWCRSEDSLVYKLQTKNIEKELPENISQFDTIFGVDLGWDDSNAITVLAYQEKSPHVWVIDTFKKSNQTISQFADTLRAMKEKYQPVSIVADTGGLGKAIVQELNQRYHFQIKEAEKKAKLAAIEMMNSDFMADTIKLFDPLTKELQKELYMIQWDEDRQKIDERSEDHLADAFLYAFRESKHYHYEKPVPVLKSKQELEVDDYWQQKEEALQRAEEENQWWNQ